MAGELLLTVKAVYAKSRTAIEFPDATTQAGSITITGTVLVHDRKSIGTSEVALPLGDVATGGYFIATNRDATNFISIRAGTAERNFVKLKPNEVCAFRISSGAPAPFAIADTAACNLEYLLLSD